MYQYICSNVCAARYSGVVTFKHSKVRVVSGCTQKPSPGSQVTRVQWSVHFDVCVYKVFQNSDFCLLKIYKSFQFCPDHKDDTGPVVLAEHLSNETRAKLKASRSQKDYAQGCKMQLIRHYIFFLFSKIALFFKYFHMIIYSIITIYYVHCQIEYCYANISTWMHDLCTKCAISDNIFFIRSLVKYDKQKDKFLVRCCIFWS